MTTAIAPRNDSVTCERRPDGSIMVVAERPEHLAEYQASLVEWARHRLRESEAEVQDLQSSIDTAKSNGWRSDALRRQRRRAVQRVHYYEKMAGALEAGYCIVPDFPVDVIAIRTQTTSAREPCNSTWKHQDRDQTSEAPPAGEGAWMAASPKIGSYIERGARDGRETQKRHCYASDLREVELPVAFCKPTIMTSISQAMALGVFDEIGVLPARKKPDPLVVGRIYDKSRTDFVVTFIVASFIDTRDL